MIREVNKVVGVPVGQPNLVNNIQVRYRQVVKWLSISNQAVSVCLWLAVFLNSVKKEVFDPFTGLYLKIMRGIVEDIFENNPVKLERYRGLIQLSLDEFRNSDVYFKLIATLAIIHLLLVFSTFVFGLIAKISSAFTGASVSSIVWSLQVIQGVYSFYGFGGDSNWTSTLVDFSSAQAADKSLGEDYFEAKHLFWPLYGSAWFFPILAILSITKAIKLMDGPRISKLNGSKYILYSLLWVDLFAFALIMDATLFHYYVQYKTGLMVTMIIAVCLSFAILGISVIQKQHEGDAFYQRHEDLHRRARDCSDNCLVCRAPLHRRVNAAEPNRDGNGVNV